MSEAPRIDQAPRAPSGLRDQDKIRDRFEAAWRAGGTPRLEAFLEDTPEPERQALLAELLNLDVVYRQKAGERPGAEEYHRRFPGCAGLIDAFFAGGGLGRAQGHEPHGRILRPDPWARLRGLRTETAITARYELLGEVGRGGMGVVYRARHKGLERQVAIKVMLPSAATERFLREARILAKIRSPRVVTVHDFEALASGFAMLVMEWVEGSDLGKLIHARSGGLPEHEVVPWMRHTCEGMLAAAEQGIIHRDLKPSNLLIDAQGHARVADFGLARGPATLGELSQSGGIMGTPFYMAPEQAEDPHGVDARADVYSFGATFYHALTGKAPFEGATAFSVLYKHKTEPLIPPRAHKPEISERINELLERCLAKAPADRFSSFSEVLAQLQPSPHALSPWAASDDTELADYLARYQSRKEFYLDGDRTWGAELDVYRFPRGQLLKIVYGNIVEQRVDALVSSDTSYLSMDWGVSGAIRNAAGEAIAGEAKRQAPVRPGRVAVSSAGKLAARLVFHAVTVGVVGDRVVRPSRDLIVEIMASCIYHADSHDVQSIAFPMLGTGAARFPRDICLDTMFQFLARMFLRGLTPVREGRIVLFD